MLDDHAARSTPWVIRYVEASPSSLGIRCPSPFASLWHLRCHVTDPVFWMIDFNRKVQPHVVRSQTRKWEKHVTSARCCWYSMFVKCLLSHSACKALHNPLWQSWPVLIQSDNATLTKPVVLSQLKHYLIGQQITLQGRKGDEEIKFQDLVDFKAVVFVLKTTVESLVDSVCHLFFFLFLWSSLFIYLTKVLFECIGMGKRSWLGHVSFMRVIQQEMEERNRTH